jgi:hypothetical protein
LLSPLAAVVKRLDAIAHVKHCLPVHPSMGWPPPWGKITRVILHPGPKRTNWRSRRRCACDRLIEAGTRAFVGLRVKLHYLHQMDLASGIDPFPSHARSRHQLMRDLFN